MFYKIIEDEKLFNVNDMSWMFYNCDSLTSLNLSNFNIDNVTNVNNMFSGIKNECYIIINDQKIRINFNE